MLLSLTETLFSVLFVLIFTATLGHFYLHLMVSKLSPRDAKSLPEVSGFLSARTGTVTQMCSSGCDLSTSITTRWVYSINVRVTLNDSIDISKHYWFWSYYNYLKTINTALLEWNSSRGRQKTNEEFASITHTNQF